MFIFKYFTNPTPTPTPKKWQQTFVLRTKKVRKKTLQKSYTPLAYMDMHPRPRLRPCPRSHPLLIAVKGTLKNSYPTLHTLPSSLQSTLKSYPPAIPNFFWPLAYLLKLWHNFLNFLSFLDIVSIVCIISQLFSFFNIMSL